MDDNYPISLQASVLKRIKELNFQNFFEVQSLAAQPVYTGENCRIMAPTGSGKTLSYLLPLGKKLTEDKSRNVVVLASSAELASQIHTVFKEFYPDILTVLLVGKANVKRQKDRLKKKPQFICATPEKAIELFTQNKFPVSRRRLLLSMK